MEQPLVSIVLPTYNGAKYLRQSIDSCLAQTYRNIELIIINDCSTDNTASIIESYLQIDSRVKSMNNKVNKKLPLSLNAGFDMASGSLFTWTSDDNYYADNAIEVMVNVLLSEPHTSLVYTDYTLIDNQSKVSGIRVFNDVNLGFHKWLGCGACFLYKADVHRQLNGYNPAAFLIEDYEFFTRAFISFVFKYIPVTNLYYYREHDSSLTALHAGNVNDISKICIERLIPQLAQKISRKDLALLYRKYVVYYAVQKNNILKMGDYLSKLYEISPKQTFVVLGYIPLKKLYHTVSISAQLVIKFLSIVFRSKK